MTGSIAAMGGSRPGLMVGLLLGYILLLGGTLAQDDIKMLKSDDSMYLKPGGRCLVSSNGAYKLCLNGSDKDDPGRVSLYNFEDGTRLWKSDSADPDPMGLIISEAGQLVAVSNASGEAYWRSQNPTAIEEGPFDAVVQNNGNVIIKRRKDNKVVWSTFPVPKPVCPKDCPPSPGREFKDRLFSNPEKRTGLRLLPGECLVSCNGKFHFCFEGDGNVVLYGPEDKQLWESGSGGKVDRVRSLFMDYEDGQLVAQDLDKTVDFWLSIPHEEAKAFGAPFTAVMKDDGNFEITRGDGAVIWATNTTVKPDEPAPAPVPAPVAPTPSPAPAGDSKSKKPSTAMIAGIVAGVVLGLAALVGGAWFIMKRRKAAQLPTLKDVSPKPAGTVTYVQADLESGKVDQSGAAPGRVALVK